MSQATESDSVCVVYSVTSYLQSCRNCRWKKCIILCWTLRWRGPLGFLQPEQPSSLMSHMRETSRICMRRVTLLIIIIIGDKEEEFEVLVTRERLMTTGEWMMTLWCDATPSCGGSDQRLRQGGIWQEGRPISSFSFCLQTLQPIMVQVSWFPIVVTKGFQITCKQWRLGGWAAILPSTQNN